MKNLKLLRNRLTEVKLLIIDELSMVSSDLWTDTPARRKLIFSQFSDKDSKKHLSGLQLWHLF